MAKRFEAPYFTKAIGDLADINKDLVEVTKEYTEAMMRGRDKLIAIYGKVFKMKFSILNKSSIYELELVRMASKSNDTKIQEMVSTIK